MCNPKDDIISAYGRRVFGRSCWRHSPTSAITNGYTSMRWGNTTLWARFPNTTTKQRYTYIMSTNSGNNGNVAGRCAEQCNVVRVLTCCHRKIGQRNKKYPSTTSARSLISFFNFVKNEDFWHHLMWRLEFLLPWSTFQTQTFARFFITFASLRVG